MTQTNYPDGLEVVEFPECVSFLIQCNRVINISYCVECNIVPPCIGPRR